MVLESYTIQFYCQAFCYPQVDGGTKNHYFTTVFSVRLIVLKAVYLMLGPLKGQTFFAKKV